TATTSPWFCENAAGARQCWGNYNTSTDYYNDGPRTGVTRTYSLTLTRATVAPDGFAREAMLVNGQLPGPTIEADWGDIVEVHVSNQLETNGTAIHFHGIRQHGSNAMDGVPGVTQCALAPGDSQVYRWVAEQYGFSWYHSHFSLQYGNGMLGPLIVRGPVTADYDDELEPLVVMDWYHADSFYLHSLGGPPPNAPSGLINGKGQFNGSDSYHESSVVAGKKYLMRIVNSGTFTHVKFWVDGHKLTVVSADFVAVDPYEVDFLDIALGQRYMVVLEADQDPDNYWIRA
ncbi:laccase, multicopper oxidase, benzenediol:oxygen oxidorectuctase, partial [Cladochytrium tenue]